MITYRVDITVDRPAADVFPYLADVGRYPEWMGGRSTAPLSRGPLAPGYRYRYETDEGLFEMEVTTIEPGRSVESRTVTGPMAWEGTFEVAAENATTSRVTSSGRFRLSGLKRLAEPFLAGEVRRREREELIRLKALVEREPAH